MCSNTEFELLQQAMYTDPSDQSIWIYHRWLVSLDPNLETLEEQIQVIHELAEMEPESKCESVATNGNPWLTISNSCYLFITIASHKAKRKNSKAKSANILLSWNRSIPCVDTDIVIFSTIHRYLLVGTSLI